MNRGHLTLEALALRRVIKERGIQDVLSDLVPTMRRELEELARLPGSYKIVDIQMDMKKEEDTEAVNLMYSEKISKRTLGIQIGGQISVSRPNRSSWTLNSQDGNLYKLSLEGKTIAKPNSVTHFQERFVEDAILKSMVWGKQDVKGKGKMEELWAYRLDSFKLDHRGDLSWTSRLHSSKLRETLVFTTRTRRVLIGELSVERLSRSLLYALVPLGGALLIRDLWYAKCLLVSIFV